MLKWKLIDFQIKLSDKINKEKMAPTDPQMSPQHQNECHRLYIFFVRSGEGKEEKEIEKEVDQMV